MTDVRDGERLSWRTTSGTPSHGARRVTPLGPSRTRVDLELTVGVRAGQRLLRPVLSRLLARTLREDAARLRALVESGAADRTAGVPAR